MIKERTWPVRAIYILIAAALAISLMITVAPAHKVSANSNDVTTEWDKVSTPNTKDWGLAPDSTIIDYAVASGGDVAYAAVFSNYDMDCNGTAEEYCLLKSTDGAATWKDITKGVKKEIDKKNVGNLTELLQVACDLENSDFVTLALSNGTATLVFLSDDGGTTFKSAGEVNIHANDVYAFEISPAVAGDRNIVIGGTDGTKALLFRTIATGTTAGTWEDATNYAGWNDKGQATNFTSAAVVDIQFSPNFKTDKVILAATANNTAVQLQSGMLGDNPVWNKASSLSINAVQVIGNVTIADLGRFTAGITLPTDYYADKKATNRYAWVWVNYFDSNQKAVGQIIRVKDTSIKAIGQQIEDSKVFLADVSYWGTIAEGKAIAGVLGDGIGGNANCCDGVQVYNNLHIASMDICCIPWEVACKLPTGRYAMDAFYVSADKAYAVALGPDEAYDESAWSVSFDDGNTWNQLSLIDTNIDYLSDVAVSPDCNKIMLVSVNLIDMTGICCPNTEATNPECTGCDSVWVYAKDFPEAGYSEYSGHWLRTWCSQLEGNNADWFEGNNERGLLRLVPGEETGNTVYLFDRMTDNIYLNDLETLDCWTTVAVPTVDHIVDMVATGNETLCALDTNGDFAMYDAEGWHDSVDSKVDAGWTIAVRNSDILVGGQDGDVSYSSDGGDTFALLEETATSIHGLVTVAFDSYFATNKVIYAATADITQQHQNNGGGIYRWVIDTSDKWKNLGANEDYNYTGLQVGRLGGNPFSSAATGGVLYASYVGHTCGSNWSTSADDLTKCWANKGEEPCWDTGVARCLTPAAEISCEKCVEWDYLTVGLTGNDELPYEYFVMGPQALKICGCKDATTNTKLFAIGMEWNDMYDMCKAKWGTVWTFEDCYAKKAPAVTATNATIPADCDCNNLPFTINWAGVCDACYYDVQIALDNQFTNLLMPTTGSVISYSEGSKSEISATGLSYVVPGILTCQVTYYWRVRAHEASTCQIIHSWWSDAQTFTVAPSASQGAVHMGGPASGAQDMNTQNVGFTWDLLASADSYDWVLSKNADLSNPIESKTGLTSAAYTCTKTLDYNTTYYWQVKAYKGATLISTSPISTFTTAVTGKFCCPIDGLCFDTVDLLKAHTASAHPAQPATPSWVWVVIAIGAVLVIVVIVLIFRTRRV
jgi:hypothetical protein